MGDRCIESRARGGEGKRRGHGEDTEETAAWHEDGGGRLEVGDAPDGWVSPVGDWERE
jgi:hypothetical protein